MSDRRWVPPPDAAPSPNGAPGREFWMDRECGQNDADADLPIVPQPIVVPNPALPNLTRQLVADQLYTVFVNAGNSPSAARTLANARALQMIP